MVDDLVPAVGEGRRSVDNGEARDSPKERDRRLFRPTDPCAQKTGRVFNTLESLVVFFFLTEGL